MRIGILSILLLVSIKQFSCAQGDFKLGFIIKSNGDSIPGLLLYRLTSANYKTCIFKLNSKAGKEEYTPSQLRAYGFWQDKRYETKVLTTSPVFVEVLVKGRASLFLYNHTFYFEKDNLIMLPPPNRSAGGKKDAKTEEEFIIRLNAQLADCELTANDAEYNQLPLTYLVQNYNRCKGSTGVLYKRNLPATQFDFQIFSSLTTSSFTVEGITNPVSNSRSVSIGASADFSKPRINDRLLLSLESWYANYLFQNYDQTTQGNSTTRTDNVIELSFLKIPIGFRYNFFRSRQTPYFKVGFVQCFKLKSQIKTISEVENNGIVTTDVQQGELNSGNFQGFWMSAGYTFGLTSRVNIFGEARYEKTNGLSGLNNSNKAEISNFEVLVGLRF